MAGIPSDVSVIIIGIQSEGFSLADYGIVSKLKFKEWEFGNEFNSVGKGATWIADGDPIGAGSIRREILISTAIIPEIGTSRVLGIKGKNGSVAEFYRIAQDKFRRPCN